jgi:8-oxo-dGTP pyrophosphatase MutT (NUDIX family)
MGDAEWKTTNRHTAYTNPYFSVLEQTAIAPGGRESQYYSIDFPRPAVGVIARNGTDVLMIRQYRVLVSEYVWAIPSGGVDPGESLEAAALRELEEETGYAAGRIEKLLGCYASYGCSNQRFEIFLADEVRQVRASFDSCEVIEVRWFTTRELLELINRNGVVDNLSLSPLLLFLLRIGCA